MLAVREVGGKKGERDFRGRATETRKPVPAAENKLEDFKNFTISASSNPRITLSLLLPSGTAPLPFHLVHYFLFPTARFFLPRLFHNNIPPQQLAAWPHPPVDVSPLYFIPIVNSSSVHTHTCTLCPFLSLPLHSRSLSCMI